MSLVELSKIVLKFLIYIILITLFFVWGGGGGKGGDKAGGKCWSWLLGEAAPSPLRAAAGGSRPKSGQRQKNSKASQLQWRLPGGPRYKTGYRTIYNATSSCVCVLCSAVGRLVWCWCNMVGKCMAWSFVFVLWLEIQYRNVFVVCYLEIDIFFFSQTKHV